MRLYKYNTSTGVFDLLEDRTFNPVTTMGSPADEYGFWSVYFDGISEESHTRYLTEGRYKVESEIPSYTYGLSAEITVTNEFKYRKHLGGTGWDKYYRYNAGGIRIKKVKFTSPVTSSSFEKNYDYMDDDKSSGHLETPFANISSRLHWGEMRYGGGVCPQYCQFMVVHHDNIIPLGNSQGGVIGYAKVTETMNDGRKKAMYYSTNYDYYSYPLIDHTATDNSAYRGRLLKVDYFNGANQKLRREIHAYKDLYTSFSVTPKVKNLTISFGGTYVQSPFYQCMNDDSDVLYPWSSYWHYQRNYVPKADTVYTFNGLDTLKEVTKYGYTNTAYNLPSTITRINADGDSTVTRHKYPYDFSSYSAGVGRLIYTNTIAQPVETYVTDYISGSPKVTSAQLASFKASIPVPDTVYSLSNTDGITDFSPVTYSSGVTSKDSRYKRKLLFNLYNNGDVVEQRKEDDVKEVLVWGYKRKYIVARVSSSDYNTVIALVDSTVIQNPSSDAAMRTELNKIRTGLASTNPKAKVTTYTWSVLKGMSSMTDPDGETTYYEYDNYGRLKRRKDADGQLKENLWYHYKP